jgi:DNA repair protein RecN (Recombination protein N)
MHLQAVRGCDILGTRAIMLKLLIIKNIALIPALEIAMARGLTLLTGETGAGKSILVDSLGLLLGARASSDLIRTGADSASVEGLFEVPDATALLEPHGLPAEDGGEIIIRREITAAGKGKATVNGALAPVSVVREIAGHLMSIHGQHEPQGLLNPDTHLELVDRFAGTLDQAAEVADAFKRWREVVGRLEALRRDTRERERRREMLEFQATEIEKAGLTAGEEEALRQEKQIQASAGRLASLSEEAYQHLFEEEESVLSRLGQMYRKIEELSSIDPRFAGHMEAGASVRAQLDDLALFLRDYRETLHVAPGRLDEIEGRLAAIERLKRKYGATLEEVLAFGVRCREELEASGSPEEEEARLRAEEEAARAGFLKRARALSTRRRQGAKDLERKVEAELAELAMAKTRFRVSFTPETPGPDGEGASERGLETAEFLLSPNPGEDLRPLARIASGGELSRILLALNSVAAVETHGKVLVFDEVDAGIGGAVAEVVGRKLKGLAKRHQVLCVTHLPQIASLANQHFSVRKRVEKGRTVTEARPLSEDERIDEVARMLAGEAITESARKYARELVRQAHS